jgi:hypothetical protein
MRKAFLALTAAILVLPMPLLADSFMYSYAGLDFTNYTDGYTSADSVTGTLTLDTPLADDLTTLTTIDPTFFSFTDGVNTISNTSFDLSDSFQVETDGSGNITAWVISLVSGPGGFGGEDELFVQSANGATYDEGIHDEYEYSYEYEYEEPWYYSCGFFGDDECLGGYNTYYETEYSYTNDGYGEVNSAGSWASPVPEVPVSATPEPSSLMLLATGFIGAACFGRRRLRRSSREA